MSRVDLDALAWALADSAATFMPEGDRTRVFTKIGVGEQHNAITDLLIAYANAGVDLPSSLVAPVGHWIDGYAGSERERVLRNVYSRIIFSRQPVTARSPQRLVARRGKSVSSRAPTHAASPVSAFGMTTCVEDLVDAAVHARRIAQSAVEVAVREARSVGWSWDRIAAALGESADVTSLCRKFG